MKTRMIIVASIVGFFLFIGSVLFYASSSNKPISTGGGSGQLPTGSLILTGYETEVNDNSKIPLGKFLTSDQEEKIKHYLETLLYNNEPKQEYKGTIVPGSVDIDYKTNVIQFKVEVEEPKTLYIINYNPVDDEMSVRDESGQLLALPEKQ